MPRNLPSQLLAAVQASHFELCLLADIGLVSGTAYLWSGMGNVQANGNTYGGIGSFGAVSDIEEGSEVRADGMSIALSGIDPALMADTLNDIQVGAKATVWLGLFAAGAIAATYALFSGTVDKPTIVAGVDTITIAIALETRMANLQRATNRRYTAADQRNHFPLDSGFNWVEVLNDIALLWG